MKKIQEQVITSPDSYSTIDLGDYYAILPSDGHVLQLYKEANIAIRPVLKGFSYDSGSNPDFLSIDQLRDLISNHVDPTFEPL